MRNFILGWQYWILNVCVTAFVLINFCGCGLRPIFSNLLYEQKAHDLNWIYYILCRKWKVQLHCVQITFSIPVVFRTVRSLQISNVVCGLYLDGWPSMILTSGGWLSGPNQGRLNFIWPALSIVWHHSVITLTQIQKPFHCSEVKSKFDAGVKG